MVAIVYVILAIVLFTLYVVVHEWIHGVAFRLFNKNTKEQVKFGVSFKSALAYCISTIPVQVPAARLSLMMPVYVVCLPLFTIAFITNSVWLALLASYYISGSVGDFYYMWKLRKSTKNQYMYELMPTRSGYEIGYLLFEKI